MEKKEDHRTKVTNMLIRRAFTQLLREKPIRSITVRELCERAGIHRGTFYAHYTDVYQLLEQVENEMLREFEKAMEPLLTARTEELTPLKITTGVFQCLQENADLCIVTLGPYGDKDFARRLIETGRKLYEICYRQYFADATAKQLEYYYSFVSSGCIGLLETWLRDGMSTSVTEIAAIAEGIMLRGIGFLGQK